MFTLLWILFWGLGLWVADTFGGSWWLYAATAGIGAATIGLTSRYSTTGSRIGWFILAVGLGGWRLIAAQPTWTDTSIESYLGLESIELVGEVLKEPETRENRQTIQLEVTQIRLPTGAHVEVDGTALLQLPRYPTLKYGTQLTLRGTLAPPRSSERFDYAAYLARQGIYVVIEQPIILSTEPGRGRWWWHALYQIKGQASDIIDQTLRSPQSGLLKGILLGTENALPAEVDADFRTTGITHIVVISGFNISIIAAIFLNALSPALGKRRAAYVAIAGIFIYTFLVGADAAVMRAAIMGTLYVISERLLGQKTFSVASLFVAGFVMTAINPHTLWDVGFQLSFAATLSLMLYADPFTHSVRRWLGRRVNQTWTTRLLAWINESVLVTLAAQVLTLPLLLYYFEQLSVVSLLANAFILPLQPGVMFWGGSGTLIGLISPMLARPLMLVASVFLWATIEASRLFASLPFAIVAVPFSLELLLITYVGVGLWTVYGALEPERQIAIQTRLFRHVSARIILTLLVIGLIAALRWSFSQPDGKLHIHIIDGDPDPIALIRSPSGRHILVNTGRSPNELTQLLGRHLPLGRHTLDLVIIGDSGEALPALDLPVGDMWHLDQDSPPVGSQWRVEDRLELELIETTAGFESTTSILLTYDGFSFLIGEAAVDSTIALSDEPDRNAMLQIGHREEPGTAPILSPAEVRQIHLISDGHALWIEASPASNP